MERQLVGGVSRQVAAHEAENAATAHFGGRSFCASGMSIAWAQQIGADAGQSEAVAQESDAFDAQEAAQAFVCAARFAQHT